MRLKSLDFINSGFMAFKLPIYRADLWEHVSDNKCFLLLDAVRETAAIVIKHGF